MVYSIGELGLMKDGNQPRTKVDGKNTREYVLWKDMLKRCYSNKYHERYPTYKDCVVCERWLIFANFLEDLPLIENYKLWKDNPNNRISLDKDDKIKGNKVYSLNTCKFISNSDNVKERVIRCGTTKPSKKVMAISLTEKRVIIFQSMAQAKELGFDSSNICRCCQDKQKAHKEYKWKYIE